MFQGVRYAPHSVRSETHRSPLSSAECNLLTSFTYIVARKFLIDECAILFLGIKKDSVKSISAFYAVFRLCNAHKLYFNIVFKLLPYVALANGASLCSIKAHLTHHSLLPNTCQILTLTIRGRSPPSSSFFTISSLCSCPKASIVILSSTVAFLLMLTN